MSDERLAETFVELADTLVDDFDLIEFWHLLVNRCVALLDIDAAGLLIADPHGALAVVAAPADLTPPAQRVALALADVATIGVLQHRAIHHRQMMVEQLQTALRRHARHHHRRLSDVATAVLDGTLTTAELTKPTATGPDPAGPDDDRAAQARPH